MMNLGSTLRNPNLCTTFTVHRSSGGNFASGGWVEGAGSDITMTGIVHPATAKEHDLLPEGERIKEAFTFYTVDPIYESRNSPAPATSDNIIYLGVTYQVHWVKNYSVFGYYKSIAVRQDGD